MTPEQVLAVTQAEAIINAIAVGVDFPDPEDCDSPLDLCGHWLCAECGCVVDHRAAIRNVVESALTR